MRQEIIMVVAADLIQVPCPPYRGIMETRVGPETARVCTAAARLSNCLTHALVYVTAGRAPRHGVLMGAGPMRTFLIESGIPQGRIRFPIAEEFTTNGEMEALARALFENANRMQTYTIHLVCRWWHLPRAAYLLRAHLGRNRPWAEIRFVPVWTFADPLGMLREPFAWAKNLLAVRNVLRTA